jgi:hypothetical protein
MKEVLSVFTFGIGALCFVVFVTVFKPNAISAVAGPSKPEYCSTEASEPLRGPVDWCFGCQNTAARRFAIYGTPRPPARYLLTNSKQLDSENRTKRRSPEVRRETGVSEKNRTIPSVGGPELKSEMATDTGLNCQANRSEKTLRLPLWRRERNWSRTFSA